MSKPRRQDAFTLIELIVALGILSLVLLLVNQLFNSTMQAVSRGADTSDILSHSRTISDQLHRDARYMVRAYDLLNDVDNPGFIVLLQQHIPAGTIGMPDPTQARQDDPANWDKNQAILRSDQLVFFRESPRIESVTPGSDEDYASDASSRFARIWYGHALRTGPGGEPASSNPGFGDRYNLAATQLVLGRQALLMGGDGYGGVVTGSPPATAWGNSLYADGPNSPDLNDVFYLLQLVNADDLDAPRRLFRGATDVVDLKMEQLTSLITRSGIPGFYTTAAAVDRQPNAGLGWATGSGLPRQAYKESAYTWAFPYQDERRLQVNPEAPYPYLPVRVAQGHAFFVGGVSEFAIEFAADITDDYVDSNGDGIDDEWDPAAAAALPAADSLPDGLPDTDGEDGPIKWYSAYYNDPDENERNFGGAGVRPGNTDRYSPDYPTIYKIPESGFHSGISSASGPVSGEYLPPNTGYPPLDDGIKQGASPFPGTNTTGAFVWGHTSEQDVDYANHGAARWWPYMIRIRYRLHDFDGSFRGPNPHTGEIESGRWFEQIIEVPRPDSLD
jgi:prepilin-type N-terminal cleavage/methylation domain-containing protein